jgi:hypothetical protein
MIVLTLVVNAQSWIKQKRPRQKNKKRAQNSREIKSLVKPKEQILVL